jgi:hypothetical protein
MLKGTQAVFKSSGTLQDKLLESKIGHFKAYLKISIHIEMEKLNLVLKKIKLV